MRAKPTNTEHRWRRFLLRAVPAALAIWGMLLAMDAGAFQQPGKDAPKKEEPTKEAPKADTKDDEPRYEFSMNGKPWKDVLTWLYEKTNLPIVGVGTPTGSLTLIGTKKYTISEVIDIINEGLLANEDKQKYILIRRERNFVLVPADKKEDLYQYAPVVNIPDLKKHGRTEHVIIVKPLKQLVAEEVAPEYQKMLSPFGQITSLKPNSLRILDNVANLEHILEIIKGSEQSTDGQPEVYSYVCKFVRAREAENTLNKLLPSAEQQLKMHQASAPAPVFGDPRDPRNQPRQPAVALPKLKVFSITSDEVKNVVYVVGPADIIAKARELLEKNIDKGDKPIQIGGGTPYWKTYQIPGGNAAGLAAGMKKTYPETPNMIIQDVGNNALRVFAAPADHKSIMDQIDPEATGGIKPELIYTGVQDPAAIALMLVKWLGESKTGAPNIEPLPEIQAIAVRGTKDQIDEIKKIIQTMNGTTGGAGAGGGLENTRIITLDKGSAATVAEMLQKTLPQITNSKVEIVNPGAMRTPPPERERPQVPPMPPSNPKQMDKVPEEEASLPAAKPKEYPVAFKADEPFVDPKAQREAQNKTGAPLIINASGDKIIITCDDPQVLAKAQALIKMWTKTKPGEGDFQVIAMKYGNAATAATGLDEFFNGQHQEQRSSRSSRSFFGGGDSTPSGPPREDRIRVVADTQTNSLLVRATPLDMMTVHRLLEQAYDNPNVNSAAIQKSHTITLKYTKAHDVAAWLKDVYQIQTKSQASDTTVGGLPGFGFSSFSSSRSSSGSSSTTANANAQKSQLSLGVDDQNNTLILLCTDPMFKNVSDLVMKMEDAAKKSPRTFRTVSMEGIDPVMLGQAIQAITGQPMTMTRSGTGSSGQTTPGAPYQRTTFPGGDVPTPFIGFPAGGPGGSPGGSRGGGRSMGDPSGGSSGGPGFFAERVKDDPELADCFFDPQHDYSAELTENLANPGDPVGNDAGRGANPIETVAYHEAQLQPPMQPVQPIQPGPAMPLASDAVPLPRSTVNVEPLDLLGLIVVSGNNPEDVELVIKIIELIRAASAKAAVQVKFVQLQQADATVLANVLTQLYQRVIVTPYGNSSTLAAPRTTTTQGFIAQITQTQSQPSSVVFLPWPRFNALILAAPGSQIDKIITQIKEFDKPNSSELVPFHLSQAAASRVATLLTNFYNQRYSSGGEGVNQHQTRFLSDDKSNTVLVQASPADLKEIAELIKQIDENWSKATNDIRIYRLRNALSDDMVTLLSRAIADGIVPPSTQPGGGATPTLPGGTGPGGPGAGFGTGGAPGTTAPGATTAARPGGTAGTAIKAVTLHFVSRLGTAESGLFEDVHLYSDPRTNSVIVFAPPPTMQLLLSLIAELDVPPQAHALVKVYKLKKADATAMANMLQQLYIGSSGTTTGARPGTTGGAPGGTAGTTVAPSTGIPGAFTSTSGTVAPLQVVLPGLATPEGAPLIPVRLTVDDRTNSIIYAGSEADVRVIEALLAKLDDTPVQTRRNEVFLLKNMTAVDAANALTTFITSYLQVESAAGRLPPFEYMEQYVVVVGEPITNKLLISAAPAYFPEVYRLVQELDMEPPQVMIQVMIAEVDLTGDEEFGCEIGLQSPVLFDRSILPLGGITNAGTNTYSFSTTGTAGLAGTAPTGGNVPTGTTVSSSFSPVAFPGFAFTNPTTSIAPNNPLSPGIVGVQGLSNLGVGRVSPTQGIGGFVFSASSDTFNLLIRALKTQGRMDILNGTEVMTVDNQSAGILVGQQIPILSSSTITVGATQGAITYKNVGVQLQVTPKISPDGKVLMRVLPEVSSVGTIFNLGNGIMQPAFNVQNVETTILAQDGETVAIGGLISKSDSKTENKVPVFGDLPVLGTFFRYRAQTKTKTELLVILTPHIIRNPLEVHHQLCDDVGKMNWCLSDIERLHGPLHVEDCPQKGCVNPIDGPIPINPMAPIVPRPVAADPVLPAPTPVLPPPTPVPAGPSGPSIPLPAPGPMSMDKTTPPAVTTTAVNLSGTALPPISTVPVQANGAQTNPVSPPMVIGLTDQGKESDQWRSFRKD